MATESDIEAKKQGSLLPQNSLEGLFNCNCQFYSLVKLMLSGKFFFYNVERTSDELLVRVSNLEIHSALSLIKNYVQSIFH